MSHMFYAYSKTKQITIQDFNDAFFTHATLPKDTVFKYGLEGAPSGALGVAIDFRSYVPPSELILSMVLLKDDNKYSIDGDFNLKQVELLKKNHFPFLSSIFGGKAWCRLATFTIH